VLLGLVQGLRDAAVKSGRRLLRLALVDAPNGLRPDQINQRTGCP
jgi:hypothetical protein